MSKNDDICLQIRSLLQELSIGEALGILGKITTYFSSVGCVSVEDFDLFLHLLRDFHLDSVEFINSIKGKTDEEILILTMLNMAKKK